MIPGYATPEGTAAYARRIASAHAGHWRPALGLTLSSLGLGTYLGRADARDDERTAAALRAVLERGINVIDTAINYRFQRSERALGTGLRAAIEAGLVRREEVLLCTKGGYLAGDGARPTAEWFERTYMKPAIASTDDVVDGCHCMSPAYLKHEVNQSRRNLGVETIDVYYVHNPETQIAAVGPDLFYRRLTDAFRTLEACAAEGKIRVYGTATWDAYRVPESDPSHLHLDRVARCALEAGGSSHRFRAIQLPFNAAFLEALAEPTQVVGGRDAPALTAAAALGLSVFTSVPLLQTQLLGRLPEAWRGHFPGLATDAQRLLQFARSTPGVTAPLCGMKDPAHVEENAAVAALPPLSQEAFNAFMASAAQEAL